MSERPLCPMKFNTRPVDLSDWECEGEQCAWWTKSKERCSLSSIAMALWAIVDAIRDAIGVKQSVS